MPAQLRGSARLQDAAAAAHRDGLAPFSPCDTCLLHRHSSIQLCATEQNQSQQQPPLCPDGFFRGAPTSRTSQPDCAFSR